MRQRLRCCIDGESVEAIADTGSDIDVLSLEYATKQGIRWESTEDSVEFADGTIKKPCGMVMAQVSLGTDGRTIHHNPTDDHGGQEQDLDDELVDPLAQYANGSVRHVVQTSFYILDGIVVDALVGANFTESLELYTDHTNNFTSCVSLDPRDDAVLRIGLVGKVRSRFCHTPPAPNPITASGMYRHQFSVCAY